MRRASNSRVALFSAALLGAVLPLLDAGAGEAADDHAAVQTEAAVPFRSRPDTAAEKPYKQPTPVTLAATERTLDATGLLETTRNQIVATRNAPFFQELGTNGRTCFSCHQPDQAWTVSAQNIRARFRVSAGLDPIFRPVDGAVCPTAPTSTYTEKQKAYSLLLSRGLIRIGLPIPAGGEFSVTHLSDPYKCNSDPSTGIRNPTTGIVSVYRRPLPVTNLRLLTTMMWDGREGQFSTASKPGTLNDSLVRQARHAAADHEEATPRYDTSPFLQIRDFEMWNATAQIYDNKAQALDGGGATGGPLYLRNQPFHLGINDPGRPRFTATVFTPFSAWSGLTGDPIASARAAIARGQAVFNTKPIKITKVPGINDVQQKRVVSGFCGTCHDTPNGGGHSVGATLDIGVADAGWGAPPALNIAGLPVFTVTCKVATYFHPAKTPIKVTDLGRAMVSGKCIDIGKIKTPTLRGLAARAPYFHNGSAATMMDVVNFYDKRFDIGFTRQEKSDLVAFLLSL